MFLLESPSLTVGLLRQIAPGYRSISVEHEFLSTAFGLSILSI
jgi:hypothetical protein